MSTPSLTLIAAMDHRRTIGVGGDMPWHLPADLAWFKRQTLGRPLVMGRRTWESIGAALPGRTNIVISRRADLPTPGAVRAPSLEEALEAAGDAQEVMIGGGASVYAECLPRANKLVVTVVHAELEGDTFFPAFNIDEWEVAETIHRAADDANPYDLSFYTLVRCAPPVEGWEPTPGLPHELRTSPLNR